MARQLGVWFEEGGDGFLGEIMGEFGVGSRLEFSLTLFEGMTTTFCDGGKMVLGRY